MKNWKPTPLANCQPLEQRIMVEEEVSGSKEEEIQICDCSVGFVKLQIAQDGFIPVTTLETANAGLRRT